METDNTDQQSQLDYDLVTDKVLAPNDSDHLASKVPTVCFKRKSNASENELKANKKLVTHRYAISAAARNLSKINKPRAAKN